MAHQITGTDNMITARKPAWHGMGTIIPENVTPHDALKLAHLDWEVREQLLYTIDDSGTETTRENVPTHKLLVRSDNNEQLSVVGSDYCVFQNNEVANFINDVLAGDFSSVETAGSLRGGRKVWFLLDQGQHDVAGVDPILKYALFTTSHDGSLAFRVLPTETRVVCANTLSASGANDLNKGVSIRHKKNMRSSIDAARHALTTLQTEHDIMLEKCEKLASVEVDSEWLRSFFMRAYARTASTPPTPIRPQMTDDQRRKAEKANERAQKIVTQWLVNFEDRDGGECHAKVATSAWAAFNSVSRWADHARTVPGEAQDPTRRMESNLLGTSAKLKAEAFSTALELAC